jgi:hypothetical protein
MASRLPGERDRAHALADLVESRLPMDFAACDDNDAWPLIGTALLSRATTTIRHIFDLSHDGQAVDAATLGRSLYEHVVHFAWLAADPSAARIQQWRKDNLEDRLTADSDCRAVGVELLTDEQRVAVQRQVDAMSGSPLVLTNLAVAADQHWAGRLPGMGAHTTTQSFRGLYAVLYRTYSATAHPSYSGINPVVEDVAPGRQRVIIEREPDGRGPFGMATVLFGLGLFVAAASLGWPPEADITAVFERYPAA